MQVILSPCISPFEMAPYYMKTQYLRDAVSFPAHRLVKIQTSTQTFGSYAQFVHPWLGYLYHVGTILSIRPPIPARPPIHPPAHPSAHPPTRPPAVHPSSIDRCVRASVRPSKRLSVPSACPSVCPSLAPLPVHPYVCPSPTPNSPGKLEIQESGNP